MHSFLMRRKALIVQLAVAFFCFAVDIPAFAAEENPVSNIRVDKQSRANVFIEYDLEGSDDDVYTISLSVRLASDTTYTYTPINVIGDIGANIRPGKNKRISWRVSDEYIPAFDKEDLEYIVRAYAPPKSGGAELYIAGGVAVVGLALAIVLLSSNKTEGTTATEFPLPPGRP